MGAGAPSSEEIAATAPRLPLQRDLVPIVLAVEVDAQAAYPHPASLLRIALRLLDLADEARVHPIPPSHYEKHIGTGGSRCRTLREEQRARHHSTPYCTLNAQGCQAFDIEVASRYIEATR